MITTKLIKAYLKKLMMMKMLNSRGEHESKSVINYTRGVTS